MGILKAMIASLTIVLAYYIDLIVGDPPKWPHPVKLFGHFINFCDRRFNQGRLKRLSGMLSLISLLIIVYFFTVFLLSYLYKVDFIFGFIIESILIATTISQKGLKQAAILVYQPLKNNNLVKAREKLSWIVGRDTVNLSEKEITRATVETVAENTTDGITAPLFWAFIGGAPLALVYRAINTCDSVVGYKTDELQAFGWASARLDDLVNWIPARITGLLMLLTTKSSLRNYKANLLSLIENAKKHKSPNSGWNEAAVAIILSVQLGGINTYKGKISKAPLLGKPINELAADDIIKTIHIMNRVTKLFIIGGVVIVIAFTWL